MVHKVIALDRQRRICNVIGNRKAIWVHAEPVAVHRLHGVVVAISGARQRESKASRGENLPVSSAFYTDGYLRFSLRFMYIEI